ncbi:MAG: DUF58 domain-containing protein [Pseudomonadota bacterium]
MTTAAPAMDLAEPDSPAEGYVLTRKRVYILPTRVGWLLFGCLFAMLIGAVNYNNSLAYLLTFLLSSMALISILHTYRNQAGLVVKAARASPVHAGELASLRLQLSNPSSVARAGLMVRYRYADQASGEDRDALLRTGVAAFNTVELKLPAPSHRRGWMQLPPVVISNRYPLGLFRAWSVVEAGLRVLVYPALLGDRLLPSFGGDGMGEGGQGPHGTDDFAGLRVYQPGDSPRMVHWKAAARSEELPVKEMLGGSSAELVLDWRATSGSAEARISQLAVWAVQADRLGHSYGLSLPGIEFEPAAGPQHLSACLGALALYGR